MSFRLNPATTCDSYKLSHSAMYASGTELVYSNFTPRSNAHLNIPVKYKTNKVVFYGIQATMRQMKEEWDENFFSQPEAEMIAYYQRRTAPFAGDHKPDIEKIRRLHKLGYLPLRVKALPEGSRVNIGVPVFTVRNTLPDFYWFTNYVESYLSDESWKAITVATIADVYKQVIISYAEETGGNRDFVDFQGHDFSMRGIDGSIPAARSGSAHLLSFKGSDTLGAVDWLEYYYDAANTFVAASVPATEHSVMCLSGQEAEKETIRRLIQDAYPTGIVSIVADSWDFFKVISVYARELKEIIEARQPDSMGFAKVVFRPDSGDPADIICGVEIKDYSDSKWSDDLDSVKREVASNVVNQVVSETAHGESGPSEASVIFKYQFAYYKLVVDISWNRYDKQYYYEDGHSIISCVEIVPTPEQLGAVETLWDIFGGTTNNKGYKTLSQKVGLIYGDSITVERADDILRRLKAKGFASDNIVFGIGSYTYQYLTRDTLGFAMKATYGQVNGVSIEIVKDPVTDIGKTKKSAKGYLRVEKEGNDFVLYDQQTAEQEEQGELQVVFEDGIAYNVTTLDEIRARLV